MSRGIYNHKQFSEERKKHISESLKGRKRSEESIEKQRQKLIGKKQSEETKKKRGVSLKIAYKERRKICNFKGNSWNKGKKTGLHPKSEFKRGHSPWNKGKKGVQKINPNQIIIHHINGNHFDDRPENRMVVTRSEHSIIHNLQGDVGWSRYWKKKKEVIVIDEEQTSS